MSGCCTNATERKPHAENRAILPKFHAKRLGRLFQWLTWTGTAVRCRCQSVENADCRRSWKLGGGVSRCSSCNVRSPVLVAWITALAITTIAVVQATISIATRVTRSPSHQRLFKTPNMSFSFSYKRATGTFQRSEET